MTLTASNAVKIKGAATELRASGINTIVGGTIKLN